MTRSWNRFFLRFLNRDCAKNYRYVRFSHYAHVILHIEKPRKKHHEQGQQFKKKDPTGFFWKGHSRMRIKTQIQQKLLRLPKLKFVSEKYA